MSPCVLQDAHQLPNIMTNVWNPIPKSLLDTQFSHEDLQKASNQFFLNRILNQFGSTFSQTHPLFADHFKHETFAPIKAKYNDLSSLLECLKTSPKDSMFEFHSWLCQIDSTFQAQHKQICGIYSDLSSNRCKIFENEMDGLRNFMGPPEQENSVHQRFFEVEVATAICEGGAVCILGPRGSGKSYLVNRVLRMMTSEGKSIENESDLALNLKGREASYFDPNQFSGMNAQSIYINPKQHSEPYLPLPTKPLKILYLDALQTQDPLALLQLIVDDLKSLIPKDTTMWKELDRVKDQIKKKLGDLSELLDEKNYYRSRIHLLRDNYSYVLTMVSNAVERVAKEVHLVFVVEDVELWTGERQTFLYNLIDLISPPKDSNGTTYENGTQAASQNKKGNNKRKQSEGSSRNGSGITEKNHTNGQMEDEEIEKYDFESFAKLSSDQFHDEKWDPFKKSMKDLFVSQKATSMSLILQSCRLDYFNQLEKRLVSRLPYRQLILNHPSTCTQLMAMIFQHLILTPIPLPPILQLCLERRLVHESKFLKQLQKMEMENPEIAPGVFFLSSQLSSNSPLFQQKQPIEIEFYDDESVGKKKRSQLEPLDLGQHWQSSLSSSSPIPIGQSMDIDKKTSHMNSADNSPSKMFDPVPIQDSISVGFEHQATWQYNTASDDPSFDPIELPPKMACLKDESTFGFQLLQHYRQQCLEWNSSVTKIFQNPSRQLVQALQNVHMVTSNPQTFLNIFHQIICRITGSAIPQHSNSSADNLFSVISEDDIIESLDEYLNGLDGRIMIAKHNCSAIQILLMVEMSRLEQRITAGIVGTGSPLMDINLPAAAKAIDVSTLNTFKSSSSSSNSTAGKSSFSMEPSKSIAVGESERLHYYDFERIYHEYRIFVLSDQSLSAFRLPKQTILKAFEGLIRSKIATFVSNERYKFVQNQHQIPKSMAEFTYKPVSLNLTTSQVLEICQSSNSLPDIIKDRVIL